MKIKNKWNYEQPKKETKEERKKRLAEEDIIEDYDFIRTEKGELEIKKVGQHSLQEIINSHANEVGLENILKKIRMTGNLNLLNQKNAIYGDDTLIPKDEINSQKIQKIIEDNNKKIKELQTQIKNIQTETEKKQKEVKTNE